MFRKSILILTILATSLIVSAWETDQTQKTKLQITVLDNLGNYVEGATITIYSSVEEYELKSNRLIVGKTDKKGKFQFKGLEVKSYFLDVRKDNQTNDKENAPTGLLSADKTNKVLVIIK